MPRRCAAIYLLTILASFLVASLFVVPSGTSEGGTHAVTAQGMAGACDGCDAGAAPMAGRCQAACVGVVAIASTAGISLPRKPGLLWVATDDVHGIGRVPAPDLPPPKRSVA